MEKKFETLVEKVRNYNFTADIKKIKKAYHLACQIHKGEKRLSGISLLDHLLGVANLVADIHLDESSVIAALLHESIRKGGQKAEDLEKMFGLEVRTFVEILTSLSQTSFSLGDPRLGESVRKVFLLFSKDVRIALIRLADKVENIKTAASLPLKKRLWVARQSLSFYAPLAEILGVHPFQRILEDEGFAILHPLPYKTVVSQLEMNREEMERAVENLRRKILRKLLAEGIRPLRIFGRVKHTYSIWKKLIRYQKEGKIKDLLVKRIYDLMALMVITQRDLECYEVLGVINKNFWIVPEQFDDYIARPKPNGYRALHTVVKEKGKMFEVQIKSEKMHLENELGEAAHFYYKSQGGKSVSKVPYQKVDWVKRLSDWSKANIEEIFGEKIFVFSPKRDVYELPQGATVVDFAYAVHTQLGNTLQAARVNEKMVSLDYKLKTGDMVEVLTSEKRKGPSRDWLSFVVTRLARREILRHSRSG